MLDGLVPDVADAEVCAHVLEPEPAVNGLGAPDHQQELPLGLPHEQGGVAGQARIPQAPLGGHLDIVAGALNVPEAALRVGRNGIEVFEVTGGGALRRLGGT